jgi:hypothetical protein
MAASMSESRALVQEAANVRACLAAETIQNVGDFVVQILHAPVVVQWDITQRQFDFGRHLGVYGLAIQHGAKSVIRIACWV